MIISPVNRLQPSFPGLWNHKQSFGVPQSPPCLSVTQPAVSQHVFPSALTSPGIYRLPKRCTGRGNPDQICLRQWAVPPTPTGAPVLPAHWTGVGCSKQEQGWALVNFRSAVRLQAVLPTAKVQPSPQARRGSLHLTWANLDKCSQSGILI